MDGWRCVGYPVGEARNQRHAVHHWPVQIEAVKVHVDGVIADVDERSTALEREIAAVLKQQAWAESALLLQTIQRGGPLTAAWLLVSTLNFERCPSASAAVAYAGLAPMQRESGRSVRGRPQIGHGGHKRLRTALYLATFNAVRFNPVMGVFYARLIAAGKPKKVARCAAARKVVQSAWGVVHAGEQCDPQDGERRRSDVEGHPAYVDCVSCTCP